MAVFDRPVRIANCSGFLGDRPEAMQEMVDDGPIDVLTGDYLAELAMLILWKNRQRGGVGYAKTFLDQLEIVLAKCLDGGIKIVVNAGGLDPAGLAAAVRTLASELGLRPEVAHVEGDNLVDRLPDLLRGGAPLAHMDTGRPLAELGVTPVTANAYLGGWGIAEALRGGADIVICPRVTDAAVTIGPSAWAHGWGPEDWDELAGSLIAGHLIECGPQCTGGNYCFFTELDKPVRPGFPIAEVAKDGSFVITKHPGTNGAVTVDTVTAQLLYEIQDLRYINPDVVARLDTVRFTQEGEDRVRVSGVRGEPAPDKLKVCLNYTGGFRNSAAFMIAGLEIEEKAAVASAGLFDLLGGPEQFEEVEELLIRSDHPAARSNADAMARLRITVKDRDRDKVGRRFFDAATQLHLSSYPGFFLEQTSRDAAEFGVYWPALVPADEVEQRVVWASGESVRPPDPGPARVAVEPTTPSDDPPQQADALHVTTVRVPLGTVMGARTGDKGGNANLGVWARSDASYQWLAAYLTVPVFQELLPETASLVVNRYDLPGIRSLNFVVRGLLGDGVAATARPDPHAKSLGEFLRGRVVDVPAHLVVHGGGEAARRESVLSTSG